MPSERQETVTHSCMHAGVHTLRGTRAEQSAQVDRLRLVACMTCQRDAATERAATEAAQLALPALAGAHAEVAEALRERARRLSVVTDAARAAYMREAIATSRGPLNAAARAHLEDRARTAAERTALRVLAAPLARTAARWWLDTRDMELDELMSQATPSSPVGVPR